MASNFITHHSFADDLQLQMTAHPDKIPKLHHPMQSSISHIKVWTTAILKLNNNKTDLMLYLPEKDKHFHNLHTSIRIGNSHIFSHIVKNMGITLDSHLSVNDHISTIA